MFLIPYGTELKLNRVPVVTYGVMLVCILVFWAQESNRSEIFESVVQYCKSVDQSGKPERGDIMTSDRRDCMYVLINLQKWYRGNTDKEFNGFVNDLFVWGRYKTKDEDLAAIKYHYNALQLLAPKSLDMQLMYYPDVPNPLKMITSVLSHSDFWHIFFNLLFFLAFTPALEVLINNRWRFVAVLLAIAAVSSITYSITSLVSDPVPTLGLSGVVSGMIGLSAYLMPKAKIRVFWWLIIYVKILYVPAWIAALWFIGWDIVELYTHGNSSGINFVAHVSGGITGYLLGMLWFKNRREEVADELQEEIDMRRDMRVYKKNHAMQKVNINEYNNRLRQKEAERENEESMQRIYNAVMADNDSIAIMLLLEDYEFRSNSIEVYEEYFERMSQWKSSRALLCVGRLIVGLLLQRRLNGRALDYIEKCQQISEGFVLADQRDVLLLVQAAIDIQKYELAYKLVKDSERRYPFAAETIKLELLEIELLWRHLQNNDLAIEKMKQLLVKDAGSYKQQVAALAVQLKPV